jgi:hypothetical protein
LQLTTAKPWNSIRFELPKTIPTMISAEELRYLYWLGRDFWTARGHVVEIGPWLGGSTFALAAGMAAHGGKAHGHLHVFDSFIWQSFMAKRAPLPLQPGDDFRAFFERNLEPYRDLLVVQQSSIPDDRKTGGTFAVLSERKDVADEDRLRWTAGPIEILFVDGAKSWGGLLYLLKEVAGALVPGQSLLVCQDYKHWGSYWVPAVMELLADHFRLVHILDENTVSFSCIKPLEPEHFLKLADYETVSPARGAEALEKAACRLEAHGDPRGAVLVRLAKARYLAQRNATTLAIEAFRAVERRSSARHHAHAVEDTRGWIERLSSVQLPPSAWFRARRQSYRLIRYGRRLYARAQRLVRAQPAVRSSP